MKKLMTFLGIFLLTTSLNAAETEVKVNSKLEKVTVFLSGAQMHRKGRFNLKKGTNRIIFEGVSPGINPQSIQVKGKGEYIILDVAHRVHYPQPEPISTTVPDNILRDIGKLNDSIADFNDRAEEFQIRRSAFEAEYQLMMNSGVYKGSVTNDSIELLQKAMDYMRVKLNEINMEILTIKRKERKNQKVLNRMNNRLVQLQNYNKNAGYGVQTPQPVQQVVVTVSAKEATSGSLRLSYMVANASWSPSYDLRADNTASPVKLTYKANIRQNTGENWKDVKLTLSTINPNRGMTKPQLPHWYVDFYQPVYRNQNTVTLSSVPGRARDAKKERADEEYAKDFNDDLLSDAQVVSNYSQMTESLVNVEFKIDLPYTIESTGKDHLIPVQQSDIKADYKHYLVPKLDQDAFLVADLTDWEKLNLLPAVANIFYDGTYVGQTRINPGVMSDTMSLSLGRDRGIMVKRKRVKNEEKVKPLTSDKIKTIAWELEIRNNKGSAIDLVVQDHIPVTNNEDIEINLTEKSGAKHKESTGILEWKVKLRSRDQKKLKYGYTVKYDKDKTLALQ